MKYIDFAEKFKDFPVINIVDVKTAFADFDSRRIYEWNKAGYIKKIMRGFYVFADNGMAGDGLCFVSNKLREPSYISLEYALSHYGLIPEQSFAVTGLTTKRTASYKTAIGNFSYRTVKKALFFGYSLRGAGSFKHKMADPEKAVLDLLYLRSDLNDEDGIRGLRINAGVWKEVINPERLDSYLAVFDSATLRKKVGLLKSFINNNEYDQS